MSRSVGQPMMTPHSAQNAPASSSTSQKEMCTPLGSPMGACPKMFSLALSKNPLMSQPTT